MSNAENATTIVDSARIAGSKSNCKVEKISTGSGVIFSDGVEADVLAFNSGAVATVRTSQRRTRLVAR